VPALWQHGVECAIKEGAEMKKKLLDYIPKKYKNAVDEFYKDSRGYWLILNDGYILEDYYGAHVIHEDTINGTLTVLRQCVTKECCDAKI
jgi:hypothetical protein